MEFTKKEIQILTSACSVAITFCTDKQKVIKYKAMHGMLERWLYQIRLEKKLPPPKQGTPTLECHTPGVKVGVFSAGRLSAIHRANVKFGITTDA